MKKILLALAVAIVFVGGLALGSFGVERVYGAFATQTVGAFSPYTHPRITSLVQSTTTPCAIQSPSATSSLAAVSVVLSVSSTTASTVTVATSTTAFATTSVLTSAAVAANAQATILYGSTTAQSVIAPNTWIVVSMTGGTGTFSPSGVCSATFLSLN